MQQQQFAPNAGTFAPLPQVVATVPQAQVAPNLRITEQAINAARTRGKYLRVGEGKKAGPISITGARRNAWNTMSPTKQNLRNRIYVPLYRVAGDPASVREALIAANYDATAVDQAIANAYSAASLNPGHPTHQNFLAEEAAATAGQKSERARRPQAAKAPLVPLSYIIAFGSKNVLKDATLIAGATSKEARGPTPQIPRNATLAQRVNYIRTGYPGWVVDVSGTRVEKRGQPAMASRPVPGPIAQKNKFYDPTYPIMSDNERAYDYALRILIPDTPGQALSEEQVRRDAVLARAREFFGRRDAAFAQQQQTQGTLQFPQQFQTQQAGFQQVAQPQQFQQFAAQPGLTGQFQQFAGQQGGLVQQPAFVTAQPTQIGVIGQQPNIFPTLNANIR
jgi:hypothetical protein